MRSIPSSEVRAWVRTELLDPSRKHPVVAITTKPSLGGFLVDPAYLEQQLGELAEVVAIETGDATGELAEALPDRLDVYGGAMRVWWPGLNEHSVWNDHKLSFIHSEEEGRVKVARLRSELQRRAGLEPDRGAGRATSAGAAQPRETETVTARVLSLEDDVLLQEPDGALGRLDSETPPIDALAVCLREGTELEVERPKDHDWTRGPAPCTLRRPLPGPRERIHAELHVGDIVQGRVVNISEERQFALVELLPDAAGIVFKSEVDATFISAIGDVLSLDEVVNVQVMSLEPEEMRLSVKAAWISSTAPRPSPALLPEGAPFDWTTYLERLGVDFATAVTPHEERAAELEGELGAANQDRTNLRRTVSDLRNELRSLQDRYHHLERSTAGERNPLSGERAFLRAVRLWYAREIGEGERFEYPLRRMRVGHRFLDSARDLGGIAAEKIVEVAGQVACDRARTVEAREVHALGVSGPATASKQRVRAADDARAWRCALQTNTPSARRLHWWQVPGPDGGTVEFASVAVHDVFDIPE